MFNKALIVIPTYNERENIKDLLDSIFSVQAGCKLEVLVVDSNSPDGTGAILEAIKGHYPGLRILHQPRKMGLGSAYMEGFQFVLNKQPDLYDVIITMDADFSHHPRYLPAILRQLEESDLVIGSRYVEGGALENWPQYRKWLSRYANAYAKLLTGIALCDLTSGFHCFRRQALQRVLRNQIRAEGYAFLVELKYRVAMEGFRIREIPIVFANRTRGSSKISKTVMLEAAFIVLVIFFQRLFRIPTTIKHVVT